MVFSLRNIPYRDSHPNGLFPNLHRCVEVIPSVDVRITVVVRGAVEVLGVLEHLVTVVEHGCLVLCDFIHNLPYSGIVELGLQHIPIDLELVASALETAQELTERALQLVHFLPQDRRALGLLHGPQVWEGLPDPIRGTLRDLDDAPAVHHILMGGAHDTGLGFRIFVAHIVPYRAVHIREVSHGHSFCRLPRGGGFILPCCLYSARRSGAVLLNGHTPGRKQTGPGVCACAFDRQTIEVFCYPARLPKAAVVRIGYRIQAGYNTSLCPAQHTSDRRAHRKLVQRPLRVYNGVLVRQGKCLLGAVVYTLLRDTGHDALQNFLLALVQHAFDPIADRPDASAFHLVREHLQAAADLNARVKRGRDQGSRRRLQVARPVCLGLFIVRSGRLQVGGPVKRVLDHFADCVADGPGDAGIGRGRRRLQSLRRSLRGQRRTGGHQCKNCIRQRGDGTGPDLGRDLRGTASVGYRIRHPLPEILVFLRVVVIQPGKRVVLPEKIRGHKEIKGTCQPFVELAQPGKHRVSGDLRNRCFFLRLFLRGGREPDDALLRRGVLPRRLFLRRRGRRICGLSLRRRPQRIDAG